MNRFDEIKPALAPDEALMEANRCLMCYDAPCTRACPTHIDVPGFIKKITTGNMKGSARTIMDANILGGSCARVCPTEVLCEGACVLHDVHDKPIKIGQLQRFSTDWMYERDMALFQPGRDNGRKVALIGGGPASLSCAAELRRLGYQTVIFDAGKEPGGLNTYGVAEYKMKPEMSLKEVDWIQRHLGVEMRQGLTVGRDVKVKTLETEFDAIFVGVGLAEVPPLGIPGEDLRGVMAAIDFIAKLKMDREELYVPARVVVLGGGNTAIDCATQAMRLGADEVVMVYRRGPEEMSAYKHEIELAKQDGVRFVYHAAPIGIAGGDHVEGLVCQRTELGPKDDKGRQALSNVPGSDFLIPCDMVIRATGQGAVDLLRQLPGVELAGKKVKVDPQTYQTGNPKYFAGGDCVSGGQEVVNAVAEGKQAARSIHEYLQKGGK